MSDVKTVTVTVNREGDIILGSGIIIGKLTHTVVYDFLQDEAYDLPQIQVLPNLDIFYVDTGAEHYWRYQQGQWTPTDTLPDQLYDAKVFKEHYTSTLFRDFNDRWWQFYVDKPPIEVMFPSR